MSDIPSLVAEVVTALEAHAEAFWRRYSDFDTVLADVEMGVRVPTGSPRRLVHSALLARSGRAEDARSAIADAAR